MQEDDDDFLYGGSPPQSAAPAPAPIQNASRSQSRSDFEATPQPDVSQPKPVEQSLSHPGLISNLEEQANAQEYEQEQYEQKQQREASEENGVEAELDIEESEDDDDIEIIMEQPARSLDNRQSRVSMGRPPGGGAPLSFTPTRGAPQSSLTSEYTPIQRPTPGQAPQLPSAQSAPQLSFQQPTPQQSSTPVKSPPQPQQQQQNNVEPEPEPGPDPSTLPPVTAPSSHPAINPAQPRTVDFETDLAALQEKPWRKPGSDISDWFNYGFDEISWEAYIYRRRDVGELADVYKANVLNFSGMPEDQVNALPPEVRQMVMTGTSAMMTAQQNGGAMMNPMMDMSGMNMMPGGMMMDMNMGGMMHPGMDGNPEAEGYPSMEFAGGMQDPQQMFADPTRAQTQTPPQAPRAPSAARGGRGTPAGPAVRGARGTVVGGRGGRPPTGPAAVRPASPLPPNVPTGPRNANKYKDRDNNAPAVDGLDYGNGGGSSGRASGEPESRKRRGSPAVNERSTKSSRR